MRSTRPLGGFLLLAALALALAACGSGGGSSSTTKSASTTPAAPAKINFPKASQSDFANLAHAITGKSPILALTEQDFTPGTNRLGFGLFDQTHKQITGAPVALYIQAQGGGKVYG